MRPARIFGLVLSAALTLVGLVPLLGSGSPRPVALVLAVIVATVAVVWPRALLPLRRGWIALGRLLGRVTTPIALRVLYYGVLTPFSWLKRRRPTGPIDGSYWSPSEPPSSLERPF